MVHDLQMQLRWHFWEELLVHVSGLIKLADKIVLIFEMIYLLRILLFELQYTFDSPILRNVWKLIKISLLDLHFISWVWRKTSGLRTKKTVSKFEFQVAQIVFQKQMEAAVDVNQPNRHSEGLKDIEDVSFKNLTDENDVMDDEIDENN